ncbi:MAG TPA: hypothetical protein VF412_07220 [Bdellovibrio sp.]|uniref:ImmA/IrrE family metallo-endopeptidase n=1 Tax=Bdellovibrio sp. TaxID=28201 RepID=UPI002F0726C2
MIKSKVPYFLSVVLMMLTPMHAQAQTLEDLVGLMQKTYSADVQEKNLQLQMTLDHDEPGYFGGGSVDQNIFSISIGADIMKLKAMNSDATAFILCHEMGHLLGGEPRKTTSTWASTEGQADYFAATSCLRRIFSLPEMASTERSYIDPRITALCEQSQKEATEVAMCSRIMAAGQSLFAAIYFFIDVPQMIHPDLGTPEKPLGPDQNVNYPTLQCRLDTVVAGAQLLERPACWYKK